MSSARTLHSFFAIFCTKGRGRRKHVNLGLLNFNQLPVILVPGKLADVLYLELAYCHVFSGGRAFEKIPSSPYFCPLTELRLNQRECDGLAA